jgi:hypothetical protein
VAVNATVTAPLPPLNVAVPRVDPPEVSVTDPPGVAAERETLTVNVTSCPVTEGFVPLLRPMVGVSFCTAWLNAFDVAPAKAGSPPYTAVMECVPAVSAVVEKLATPPLRAVCPRTVTPSLNVTVLVGVPPAAADTAAVKVTFWPTAEGLGELANSTIVGAGLTVCVSTCEVLPP